MSRILFTYEQKMPTVSIVLDMFKNVERYSNVTINCCQINHIGPSEIDESDVLIFIRPNDILSRKVAKEAKRVGKTVIIFMDDDLLHVIPGIPWRIRETKRILKYADALIANAFIFEKCKNYMTTGRNVLLNTIVEEDQICDPNDKDHDIVSIVYAANAKHAVFYEEFVLPIMDDLIQKSKAEFKLTFVGPKPELSEYNDRIQIEYVDGMLLDEYRKFMQSGGFDIGLAPLPDTEFTRCKYFNKYLEYSMSGICGVYSDVIPYSSVIRNGENGYLADNTREGWLETLIEAINNNEARKKCISNAQEDLKTNFSPRKIIDKLLTDIPELCDSPVSTMKSKGFSVEKAEYYFCRIADWGYLTLYYLSHSGVKAVISKIATHILKNEAYLK